MIAHGSENVLYREWGNLRRSGAVSPGAHLYGLASHDRGLVGTDVGELDRLRRRWWPRFFRVETCGARCTLNRLGPPQLGGPVIINHAGEDQEPTNTGSLKF